jgi:tripartite-type tricarboxylate transporter receptor subunit TctC
VANSFTVNQSLIKTLPYNTTKDLQPVVLMARTANVLAVKSNLPVNNLKELIDYAKKNPGKLSYASFGNGTTAHFAGEMLKSMAGIYVVHIPYRGQGPALTDLIAGNVDLMFGNLPDFLPYIKSGKIKAIGTTYLTRAPLAPEIPTIAEQGFPTFETDSWYGIVAPSSMTKDALDKMNLAINKALQDPAVKKNFGDRGIEIIGGSPGKFQEHIQSEILKYERIVKSTKMQSD